MLRFELLGELARALTTPGRTQALMPREAWPPVRAHTSAARSAAGDRRQHISGRCMESGTADPANAAPKRSAAGAESREVSTAEPGLRAPRPGSARRHNTQTLVSSRGSSSTGRASARHAGYTGSTPVCRSNRNPSPARPTASRAKGKRTCHAEVAHRVERQVSNLEAAGSSPALRSEHP